MLFRAVPTDVSMGGGGGGGGGIASWGGRGRGGGGGGGRGERTSVVWPMRKVKARWRYCSNSYEGRRQF